MSEVTLSAAVRQNLLALQNTSAIMGEVQNRLATGLKVNSALDNPNSFFTASGLNNRANDLGNLLNDMGQAVQTIKAADQGLTSITKLVESAKAKANQAIQTQSQYERKTYAGEYNDLLQQIEDLAEDATYKGKNLLGGSGNDLTVYFNEDNTSNLTVSSVDYTDTTLSDGLNLTDLTAGSDGAASFQLEGGTDSNVFTDGSDTLKTESLLSDSNQVAVGDTLTIEDTAAGAGVAQSTLVVTATTTVQDLIDFADAVSGVEASFDESDGTLSIVSNNDTFLYTDDAGAENGGATDLVSSTTANYSATSDILAGSASYKSGDTITFTDGNGYEMASLTIDDTTTVGDLEDALNDLQGVNATFNTGTGKLTVESAVDLEITSDNANFNASAFVADTDGVNIDANDSGFGSDADINDAISRLNAALGTLRSQASTFGTNLSTVEIRQDYTKSMINTLQEGAGKLTLADTNEEGANLLALQTRQQLSSTALSFASQGDQNVLRLF